MVLAGAQAMTGGSQQIEIQHHQTGIRATCNLNGLVLSNVYSSLLLGASLNFMKSG
jgi:hypothetical protein